MKLKFLGSFAELRQVIAAVSPGGKWLPGRVLREYITLEGPKIRVWNNRTVFVQGSDGPSANLYDRLIQQIDNSNRPMISKVGTKAPTKVPTGRKTTNRISPRGQKRACPRPQSRKRLGRNRLRSRMSR
jgi:hypothetical protein